MGIMDVTFQGSGKVPLPPRARDVEGLQEGLRQGRFAAVVMDDRYEPWEFPGLTDGYRPDVKLPREASPRVVSGAHTAPKTIWLPRRDEPLPPGARLLFDFEAPTWEGFTVTGDAWGRGPQRGAGQPIAGYRGTSYASSNARGDAGRGTVVSPLFSLTGSRITLRVAGGDSAKVRVELRDAATGEVLRKANGGGFSMRLCTWDTAALRGRNVVLALVDEDAGPWGVLWVDDVRELP
jgi:hypothetical protein